MYDLVIIRGGTFASPQTEDEIISRKEKPRKSGVFGSFAGLPTGFFFQIDDNSLGARRYESARRRPDADDSFLSTTSKSSSIKSR